MKIILESGWDTPENLEAVQKYLDEGCPTTSPLRVTDPYGRPFSLAEERGEFRVDRREVKNCPISYIENTSGMTSRGYSYSSAYVANQSFVYGRPSNNSFDFYISVIEKGALIQVYS